MSRSIFFFALAATLFASAVAPADSTTRPAVAPPLQQHSGNILPGPNYVLQRYKTALSQLTLSDEEKSKADAIMNDARQQAIDLSASLAFVPLAQRYPKLRDFAQDIRQKLAGALTDAEMHSLDQKLGNFLAGNRPGTAAAGGGGFEVLQQAVDKLDLSVDQKQQLKDAFTDARQKIADLRKSSTNAAELQPKIAAVRRDLRDKIKSILTPEQMQQVMEFIQQRQANGIGQARPAAKLGGPVADNKPRDLDFSGPQPGSDLPSAKIVELNGRLFDPARYKGHVLVLEFGSMSCPVFRANAAAMEKLKAGESGRAFFLIVYTREAFPAGDKNVDRNRDEGVSVPQAKTLDERKAEATDAARELRITIPMAVDSMNDAVSNAYKGFPNAAIVIGKDGKIAARQNWTNPDTLKQLIDAAAKATPTQPPV